MFTNDREASHRGAPLLKTQKITLILHLVTTIKENLIRTTKKERKIVLDLAAQKLCEGRLIMMKEKRRKKTLLPPGKKRAIDQ